MTTEGKQEHIVDRIHTELQIMSEVVEGNVNSAIMSLIDRSEEMADTVVMDDESVDEMSISLEKLCLEALQLAKPKTDDFHFIIAALKIATPLEQVSDLTVNIARHVKYLVRKRSLQTDLSDFAEMLEFTSMMVRDSVVSLLDRNVELAFRVCAHDDLVDEAYQSLEAQLYGIMEKDKEKAVRASHLLACALDLERIADLATNITEDVVYMLEGKIVHHHIDEWRKKLAPELERRRRLRKREM